MVIVLSSTETKVRVVVDETAPVRCRDGGAVRHKIRFGGSAASTSEALVTHVSPQRR
jgi:hypothetical protein